MADRPILFSTPMVRAILREIEQPGGGKTQTRRVLDASCDEAPAIAHDGRIIAYDDGEREYRWPLTHAVGDRLYVREAWRSEASYDDLSPASMGGEEPIRYEADGSHQSWGYPAISKLGRFRQGMHMPRWASRVTLIVTDVRVQRLQEINEADAIAEGFCLEQSEIDANARLMERELLPHIAAIGGGQKYPLTVRSKFISFWIGMHGLESWDGPSAYDNNPWVAAYTFRPILGNIDQVPHA